MCRCFATASPFLGVTLTRGLNYWWRHQMEIFSALLAFCAGSSPVAGEFPAQRPVTPSFDVFFELSLKQQLSKQWRRRWFETPLRSLWRHCNWLAMVACIWFAAIIWNRCCDWSMVWDVATFAGYRPFGNSIIIATWDWFGVQCCLTQHRNSHCKDRTVWWPPHLYIGNPNTSKR